MSRGNSANLPAPPAIHAYNEGASQRDSRSYGSPEGSFSGSLGESDPQRWSFPASQYRQSAVLEMGSAVPMEIVNPQEPREIQIQRALDSLEGAQMPGRSSRGHSRTSIGISALGAKNRGDQVPSSEERKKPILPHRIIVPPNEMSSYDDPAAGQLGEPWSASTPSHSYRGPIEPSSGQPPSFIAPLSPLNHSQQSHRASMALGDSIFDNKDGDMFTTAQESGSEKSSRGSDRHPDPASGSPFPSRSRVSSRYHSLANWDPETDRDVPLPQWPNDRPPPLSDLRKLINDTEAGGPEDAAHLRSLSEPTNLVDSLHSLQATPLKPPAERGGTTGTGRKTSSHSTGTSGTAQESQEPVRANTTLPQDLLQNLPTENEPGYPVRVSSRRRGFDTVSPRVALEGKTAILDSESIPIPPRHESRGTAEGHQHSHVPRRHHKKSHSQISAEEAQRLSRERTSRRRRNFTKKSIENMMETNPTKYDIEDIGLPGPERVLLERFIESLSKLSIEVQMDDSKRDEGRRRLNNALRALEGWI